MSKQVPAEPDIENLQKAKLSDNFTLSLSAELLSSNPQQGVILPSSGLSHLHLAAYYDQLEVYCYIEKNSNLSFDTGSIPIFSYACLGGAVEVASYVIEKCKRNPDLMQRLQKMYLDDYKRNDDTNFIILATHASSTEIIRLLIDSGYGFINNKPIILNKLANIALTKAIKKSSIECITLLLSYINQDSTTLSPIEIAAKNEKSEAIPLLLETKPSNNELVGALYYACIYDNENIVSLLVPHIKTLVSNDNQKPPIVHWIFHTCNPNIAEKMLKFDINVNEKKNKKFRGISAMSKYSKDIIPFLQILYNAGYNFNDPDDPALGYILISLIYAPYKHPEIVEWFFKTCITNKDLDVLITSSRIDMSVLTLREKLNKLRQRYVKIDEICKKYGITTQPV